MVSNGQKLGLRRGKEREGKEMGGVNRGHTSGIVTLCELSCFQHTQKQQILLAGIQGSA
jgi:hypothetical protein